jgi:hypothetical protein
VTLRSTSGIWMPFPPTALAVPTFVSQVIDATGEKIAMIGRVWNKDRTSKNITKVGFRWGGVTKVGGSVLTCSLQDVSLTTGPAMQPDGTPDQTVTIPNAGITASTFQMTNAFSAARTVAFGDWVAVVVEFDGAGRLGADAFNIQGLSLGSTVKFLSSSLSLLSGTWTSANQTPNCILEFDDGTFGSLGGDWPVVEITGTTAYNSGSGADELALPFTVPFKCKVDGAWFLVAAGNTANFDICLYSGTTLMTSQTFDANALEATGVGKPLTAQFAEQTLTPGTQYYLSLLPTTVNSVTAHWYDVIAAAHLQASPPGTEWTYSTRVNAGAWAAATTTRRIWGGIRISALDDGGRASTVNETTLVN